jgi:hypothetical protein
MPRTTTEAIDSGLSALAGMQAPDGSFPLWTGTSRWARCGPLFATAYVMMGAGGLLPAANIARAVAFIRSQRRNDGLWEYDPAIRIPPDADSTACALAALALHGDGTDLANAPALLRQFWRPDAGPFRTWKAGGMWSLPQRDDPVVNCNILFALRLLGSSATPAETLAAQNLIARTAEGSRYYLSPATTAHAARRAGLDLNALPPPLTAPPPRDDLLGCLRSLCASSRSDSGLLKVVVDAQRPDGAWPIVPWVTAAETPRPFWGSPAVTTALAIEALHRHGEPREQNDP